MRSKLNHLARTNRDLIGNALTLIGTAVATSGSGFVYWLLAARILDPSTVGSAAALVSAATLVANIGMLGANTIVVTLVSGRRPSDSGAVITTASVAAGAGASLVGLVYVAAAGGAWQERLLVGAIVVATAALTSAGLVLDSAAVGLLLGQLQFVRNVVFAIVKLALLAAALFAFHLDSAVSVLGTWLGGLAISVAVAVTRLRSNGARPGLRTGWSRLRKHGRAVAGHSLLNLGLVVPASGLPVVISALLSSSTNAVFYAAYMIASFVNTIPGALSTSLFAVAAGNRDLLGRKLRTSLLLSIAVGLPVSVVVILLRRPAMSLFGEHYAQEGASALGLLLLGYTAVVIQMHFVASSRVTNRVTRAGTFVLVLAGAQLLAAGWGATHGGLDVAVGCVVGVQTLGALAMLPTVFRVLRRSHPPSAALSAPVGARS